MPIKIQKDLPARSILENENIFVMDDDRSIHQDIRPLKIGILNLMPLKEDTELQLLRALSNTPLQIDITFVIVKSHISQNVSANHLNRFYQVWEDIAEHRYDGFIITGAPVENLEFEEVDYWDELTQILDWTKSNVTSTVHLCWGAQAALYHHYGIKKYKLDKKVFGIFPQKLLHRKDPLVRGFDDVFLAPVSRYTQNLASDIHACPDIKVLAESDESGVYLATAENGKFVFVTGHPEYDRMTLDREYRRDRDKGLDTAVPEGYYPGEDIDEMPLLQWRSHANNLYTNWLNYYVYQLTPYDIG